MKPLWSEESEVIDDSGFTRLLSSLANGFIKTTTMHILNMVPNKRVPKTSYK